MTRKIELLAPAKNAQTGIEAIKHGADAVYIGADKFSARQAAGNSVEDISELVKFAHQYGAKVYVALNTVLTDEQLPEAEKLIWDLYNIDVDAIIVQDMGIMELNLPEIELHASTQTDCRTPEKVNFMVENGFSQVVLPREFTLDEIAAVRKTTDVALEIFVHGALCVSYSGQCYISEALCGRSANRGACAQYCRLPYKLYDANGKLLVEDKHLLSLKDLNQSDYLEKIIDAGATSLKIEGRLKDVDYVKNVTAYYRKRLDGIFRKRKDLQPASSGYCEFSFEPNLSKSFNRGFTNYFLNGRGKDAIYNPDTPKSTGEYIGTVKEIKKGYFTVAGLKQIHNGDGLCYKAPDGSFKGFRVNKAEENRIFPLEMPHIKPKTELYRNFDNDFEKELSKESAVRKIYVDITLKETANGFELLISDIDGNNVSYLIEQNKDIARNDQTENQKKQLSKLGNTIFEARDIRIELNQSYFIPSSVLADARREATDKLLSLRIEKNRKNVRGKKSSCETVKYPEKHISYLGNVTNEKAKQFYLDRGVDSVDPGFELKKCDDVVLMQTKHCIKYSLGWCPVHQKSTVRNAEPLFLEYKEERLKLSFDCAKCQMKIHKA